MFVEPLRSILKKKKTEVQLLLLELAFKHMNDGTVLWCQLTDKDERDGPLTKHGC